MVWGSVLRIPRVLSQQHEVTLQRNVTYRGGSTAIGGVGTNRVCDERTDEQRNTLAAQPASLPFAESVAVHAACLIPWREHWNGDPDSILPFGCPRVAA